MFTKVRWLLSSLTGPPDEKWEAALYDAMYPTMLEEAATGGRAGYRETRGIRKLVEGRFDGTDPAVIRAAEEQAAHRVVEVSAQVKATIRAATAQNAAGQLSRWELEKTIRSVAGPIPRDAAAILKAREATFTQALEAGQSRADAVQAANRVGDRMRTTAINRRARVISRTEIRTSQQMGREAGYRQANAMGLMPPGTTKVWVTVEPCPICEAASADAGDTTPWDEPFSMGPIPKHPNCLCSSELRFADKR